MDNAATAKFIADARAIHGDAYDYRLVDYQGSKVKVTIICPIHGEFEKQPNKHLSSRQGCPTCGDLRGHGKRRQTLDVFIEKARGVHGDRYDYSKVIYQNNSTKVIIGCPDHGDFQQIPNSHLNGRGCPQCAGNVQLDTAEFIARAKTVHGDTYDYSEVRYKSGKTKVKIICREHGVFNQSPEVHLLGSGCRACVKNELISTDSFIAQCRLVHGDKYDYSLVQYTGNKNKIKIICPEHGLFEQQAKSHLRRGDGCIYCAGKAAVTEAEFIRRSIVTHGETYDYSALGYVDYATDVSIGCKVHGIFRQNPRSHAGGYGCPACGIAQRGEKRRNTTEGFIEAATIIHGDTYDYSKSVYGGDNKEKLTVICREHGEFQTSPNTHLRGSGCPKCKMPSDNDAVYIWKAVGQYFNGVQLYKVGVTSSRLNDKRIRLVAKKIRMDYEIITLRPVPGSAQYLESKLMRTGMDPQFTGFDGATEFRAFTDEALTKALAMIQDYIDAVSNLGEVDDPA